ncbi:MAG TPA: 4-(cytidine 5'-diphospho)-2-C-methyl-D-erythritol kinase, partial [Bacteroidia bacterium]|nr:4-(cytidine 5'-diphospho)-2-C-methyl-D-erythritol kinase [Bacteroidia bacterium]
FYPVNWCDALEVIPTEGYGNIHLTIAGLPVSGPTDTNLCTKAYHLLNEKYKLPSVNVWLLKKIPMGAGLGGGSADAAFFILMLNDLFKLKLNKDQLKTYASRIGSDCTFFIENKPALITGKGDKINSIQIDLSNYYISVIYPEIHIDTKNAYNLITPTKKPESIAEIATQTPVGLWKEHIVNDFEGPIFKNYPQLAEIKNKLYAEGALYASMTGSGSALYGIFDKKPTLGNVFPACKIWTVQPQKIV